MTTTRTKTYLFRNSGSPNSADIVYYLSTGNIAEIKRIINSFNVDDIVDDKNKYTALHYAIRFGNKEIIDYLLSLNSSITKKTANNEDALDLCLKYQNRDLINATLNDKNSKIVSLKKDIDVLERKNKMMDSNNAYLVKSVDNLVEKNDGGFNQLLSNFIEARLLESRKVSLQYLPVDVFDCKSIRSEHRESREVSLQPLIYNK
jgi:ankyrin repeat protein